MSKMLLRRDLTRWAGMSPQAISEGSAAQFMHAMADAQHDLATLADLARRWMDAAFDFHDRHNMTQPVTGRVGKLIDETIATLGPKT